MSKSKKILSLVVALVMAISVFSICSFAAQTTPTGSVVITADNTTVGNSETVTITVTASASATFYAGPMSIPVTYDDTLFTLGTATINDIFGAGVTEKITNTATAGKVILTVIPKTDGAPVAPDLSAADLVIATITFTSDASATGTGTFAVDNDQKSTTNPTGKFYIGSFDGSNPKTAELTTMGQTLNTTPVDVNVGAAGTPELILTDPDNGAVIDRVNDTSGNVDSVDGYVYGIDTAMGEDILDYVTTIVGSVEVEDNASGTQSTGAKILLKDAGGTVVETYLFVYFGDVDGDGMVDLSDSALIEDSDAFILEITPGTAEFIAADVEVDGMVDLADSALIEDQDAFIQDLPPQADLAAAYAAL